MPPEINVSHNYKFVSSGNVLRKIFRSLHCDDMRYQCNNMDDSILQNAERHFKYRFAVSGIIFGSNPERSLWCILI